MTQRNESVRVSVTGEDFHREFGKMEREALATGAAVRSIPNKVTVRTDTRGLDQLEQRARRAERSGSALVDTAAAIWPALLPVAGLAVPALAGLSAQLGFVAAGGATALLAVHGMGDALKALNAYQLDPTAENLAKLRQEMGSIGPDARRFVRELDSLEPVLKTLQADAASGLLPGLTDGIDLLLRRLPEVRGIVQEISSIEGDLARDAGSALAGEGFDDFFDYLQTDARPILSDTARAVGTVAEAIGHLFVDFAPAERDFSGFLLDTARDFNDFADGLDQTEGFQDFMQFLDENGPRAAHALGSIVDAIVAVSRAGAPLSGPTLSALATLADIIDRIASSPLGTPLVTLAAGLALVNRALSVSAVAKNSLLSELLFGRALDGGARGPNAIAKTRFQLAGLRADARATGRDVMSLGTSWATAGARSERESARMALAGERLKGNLTPIGKGAAVVGGLALATSGLADNFGFANTTSLALAGTIAGPWGAAIGGGIGLLLDAKAATDEAAEAQRKYDDVLKGSDPRPIQKKIDELKARGVDADYGTDPVKLKTTGNATVNAYAAAYAAPDPALSKDAKVLRDSYAALDRISEMKKSKAGAVNMRLLGTGMELTADAAAHADNLLGQLDAGLQRLSGRLAARGSLTAYRSAILDIGDAVKENGKTLDNNTRKGQANNNALNALAGQALDRADKLKAAGDEAGSIRFLTSARRDLVQAAVAFGMPLAAARRLAKNLLDLGLVHAKPKVSIDDKASPRAKNIQKAIDDLHGRNIDVNINVAGLGALTAANAGINNLHSRTVTETVKHNGPHIARGGRVFGPGGPRDDQVPAWLSNGEFVVNARAYDMYRREIEWINAQGLANGGAVGRPPAVSVNHRSSLPPISVSVDVDLEGKVRAIARWEAEDAVDAYDTNVSRQARASR